MSLRSIKFDSSRPLLKHLNADSSWLLSLPYPDHIQPPLGRCRFNIVIDVWLRGPQVDLFSHFSSQEHASPSVFQTLDQVNDCLREAETVALRADRPTEPTAQASSSSPYYIDAVCCSHEFTDHCHKVTLQEIPSDVPVFAPRKAARLVKSWNHFTTIVEIPVLQAGFDWRATVTTALPDWIGIGRMHSKGDAPIYFHSALAFVFALKDIGEAEALIYTPHGAAADSMRIITTAEPRVHVLALVHGLHNVSLAGAQLNMGMKNALEVQRLLNAKYWFPTHDEVKVAYGLVSLLLQRVQHTIPVAPGSHAITTSDDKSNFPVEDGTFHDLANGEDFVLS